MQTNLYLRRLGYSGYLDNPLDVLKQLHKNHLLTVPLENLDIHYGKEITLDIPTLFHKIIIKRRGGFCYELNSLFYELLKSIGYQVEMISGRVYEVEKGFKDEFDHLAVVAHIDDESWLVDVGFGRRFGHHPLRINLNEIQEDETGRYRIIQHDNRYLAVQQQHEMGDWVTSYIFTLVPRKLSEFTAMCDFHQTSHASFFTRNKLCTIATPTGRITLTDSMLKITEHARVHEFPILDSEDFEQKLTDYFGIRLPKMALAA
ncbi:arylamine N-acetyltransferase family protein [Tellurirhabdus bombi]|uniref:arylamine N-acetyltransferase family protein n=1 Tax=Tellurirhabdus bombi TaxID=2907205 RepID=UPI001F21577C|nr:arylamine N-acetyltransferase [Tellurirhabdus bombi]